MSNKLGCHTLDGLPTACFVLLSLVHHLKGIVAIRYSGADLANSGPGHTKVSCNISLQLMPDEHAVGDVHLLLS